MSDLTQLGDRLAAALKEGAPVHPPDRLVPRTMREVRSSRRPPGWLTLARVAPVRVGGRVVVGSPVARTVSRIATWSLVAVVVGGLGVAGAALLDQQVPSAPRVIVVDQSGDGDMRTIVDAVTVARDGDTVLVNPGTYVEAVEVTKDITIAGTGTSDAVVIQAPDGGPMAPIDVDGDQDPYAMRLVDMSGIVSSVTFRGEPSQLHVWGGAPQLQGVHFEGVGRRYVPLSGDWTGNSLVLTGGTTAMVMGSHVFGGGPIGILDGSEPRLVANHLGDGPHIWGFMGDGAIVHGNSITGSVDRAIGVFGTTRALIENNTIEDAGGDGITVGWGTEGSTDAIIRGNTITASGTGINVAGQGVLPMLELNFLVGNSVGIAIGRSDAVISGNRIEGSVVGIAVHAGAPVLTANSLCGNATDLTAPAGSTLTLAGNEVTASCAAASAAP